MDLAMGASKQLDGLRCQLCYEHLLAQAICLYGFHLIDFDLLNL
jgi:hypothetical protein